jgi:hypothetical protein
MHWHFSRSPRTPLFLPRQHATEDVPFPSFVFLPGLINLSNLFHFHPSVSLLFCFLKHPSYFRPGRGTVVPTAAPVSTTTTTTTTTTTKNLLSLFVVPAAQRVLRCGVAPWPFHFAEQIVSRTQFLLIGSP